MLTGKTDKKCITNIAKEIKLRQITERNAHTLFVALIPTLNKKASAKPILLI